MDILHFQPWFSIFSKPQHASHTQSLSFNPHTRNSFVLASEEEYMLQQSVR